MTPERWQQVNELFQAVADRTPDERTTFLQTACQGDEALRREVESLIASHESAENFIESPAFEVAPELLTNERGGAVIGELIGRYRIESLIGVGGMGEVYLARDEQLGRKVALKFLPKRLTADKMQLSRFKSEARTASALNHPNILTVYEIGTDGHRHFIATEFIEGETLSASLLAGRMTVHEALEVAVQVASALDAAHKAGVVHRDIKPDNIMLRPDGYVKLLDFGIAKLTEPRSASDVEDALMASAQQTQAGLVLGTLRYMSPEQRNGQRADARSDIWSLGVVLYEMLGGVPPFAGSIVTDDIASILKTKPTAPVELQSILHKALRRDRDERYQKIAGMLADLRSVKAKVEQGPAASKVKTGWLWNAAIATIVIASVAALFLVRYLSLPGTARAPALPGQTQIPEKSIAILPFENRSHDADNAYFADAIQDEILTRLSKIADLTVISRTSTQHYKSTPANVPEIAKQLGVTHILEGSVQKSGDAVRVNVQLIKAANDAHVWADTFDRKLTDIFSVESEVAKSIADQLRVKLTGREELVVAAKPTDNPEAYDNYLRGLAYTLRTGNNPANALGAQKYLREAVRLDPKFALAWALLSYTDAVGYRTLNLQPTVALREEARQAAETALTLQRNLGEAVLAKGYYHYSCLNDYDTAERYFKEARLLLPNSSRISESLAYLERRRGQWDRSETYFNEAERLDPRNVNLLTQHALFYMLLRRSPEALQKLDQVLNITPDDMDTVALQAAIAQGEGDLSRAAALLAPLHPSADDATVLETQVYQAVLERRPAAIIPRLKEILAKPDPALGYINGELRFWLGWAQEVGGDHAAAQESWRQARSELEAFLKEQPENVQLISDLALINIGLSDKAAALALADRAMAALPIEKDAVSGPGPIEILARVAAQTGETDRAIAALRKLLSIPAITDTSAPFTPALLRLDPMFDPLRNDPRFQKIIEGAKEPVATTVPAKSIAVLPFENLSRDPDNAYFAEGVQDEILTRLSKIADLKVISRTSTRQYKSAPANVPDIAKQLGVAHILEGSVQKSGDAVRVNVQLIKAADDSHIWADTFDRKLTDAFSVESEVAKAIADQLGAKLTGQEEQVIAAKPTDNLDAYDAYLRGLAYSLKPANNTANSLGAQKYLREAVRLDPKFALAWALLSSVDSVGYLTKTLQPTVALREEARQAAETAVALGSNLGEALMAKGYYHYGCLKDYDSAIDYFEQARQILPTDSRISESLAYVTRRRGQWERSEAYFNEAERLDPRNANLLTQHAVSYMRLRRFPEALRQLDQVLNITPDDVRTVAFKAGIAQAEGDLPRAAALLAPLHPNADDAGTLETQVYQTILERRPAAIIPRLEEILDKPDPELGYFNSDLRFWLGWAQEIAGDHAAAQKSWRQARSELESFLKEQPENFNVLSDLALTNMGLGDKAAAFALAERAIAANPLEKDAVSGPSPIETLARVAAQMGEPDRAIAALRKLLSIPAVTDTAAPFTSALLRLDPMFDPLRNDSRFQELVAPAGIPKDFGTPAQIPDKSIAVLPFVNRSRDPDNAFFTDGVQDEILTDLARIADLKVISRTSVMQYKSDVKRNLRQIANELGVAHVLEGSVQRAGDRVRVNAQLIDARNDAHLWAQTYDRDLADVFAIQSEIAKTIADQLEAKLSPSEKSAIERPPTSDITAFDYYSHAKNLFLTGFAGSRGKADLQQAADLLNQAVVRDPAFFEAYCQLAFTEISIYFFLDHIAARLAAAEAAAQAAARLRPDAGESHLSRARNLYWGYLDYDGALRELEIARQSLPGEDWIFSLKAYIERRQGRWEECIRDLERATELDPRNVLTLQQLAMTYEQLRRYAEEKSTFERILAFEPNDPVTKSLYAFVELDSKADTRPLRDVINSIRDKNPAALSSVADNWLLCAFAERDLAAARNALIALGENQAALGPTIDLVFPRPFLEGVIARLAKDDAKAQAAFTAARVDQEKIVQAQPNYGPALCVLGLIDAALGRKDEALREGHRAVELSPIEKDANRGIAMVKYLAMIAAWVGDKDLALEQLAIVVRKPSDLSYGQLKLMPFWDPLRGDPRFEKIVEEAKQRVERAVTARLQPRNRSTYSLKQSAPSVRFVITGRRRLTALSRREPTESRSIVRSAVQLLCLMRPYELVVP